MCAVHSALALCVLRHKTITHAKRGAQSGLCLARSVCVARFNAHRPHTATPLHKPQTVTARREKTSMCIYVHMCSACNRIAAAARQLPPGGGYRFSRFARLRSAKHVARGAELWLVALATKLSVFRHDLREADWHETTGTFTRHGLPSHATLLGPMYMYVMYHDVLVHSRQTAHVYMLHVVYNARLMNLSRIFCLKATATVACVVSCVVHLFCDAVGPSACPHIMPS